LRTNALPAPIAGDPTLLDRMIVNLVDNAIRYNQPGGHVTTTTGNADGHTVLRIANTGRPVDPEQIDRLFEPFVRGTASARGDGVGLGLSIVHAIVSAHDGDISCLARPSGGLDISIRFSTPMPARAAEET
jgi:signal transduction histidine kinase